MHTTFEELPSLRQKHKDEQIVLKGGVFDLFHYEHLEGLRVAKEQGDLLFVGVSRDERVRQRKGPTRPITPEVSRMAIVEAIKYVDYAFLMPLAEPRLPTPTVRTLEALRPDVFAVHYEGFDWREEDVVYLREQGTEIFVDERPRQLRTTTILEKILTQNGHPQ